MRKKPAGEDAAIVAGLPHDIAKLIDRSAAFAGLSRGQMLAAVLGVRLALQEAALKHAPPRSRKRNRRAR